MPGVFELCLKAIIAFTCNGTNSLVPWGTLFFMSLRQVLVFLTDRLVILNRALFSNTRNA